MISEQDRAHGIGEGTCDVCGRRLSWGCGHTGEQRRAARRHAATRAHQEERCWHFTAPPVPGWYPAQRTGRTDG